MNHTVDQKLQIFKGIITLAVLNLAWAIFNYFAAGDFYILNSAIIYFVGFVPLFALLRWKYKRGLRFLPPLMFLVLAIYYVAVPYSSSAALKHGLTEEMGLMNLFIAFLVLGVVLC